LQFSAYPNPVSGILILKIEGEIHMQYDLSLYDIKGLLLEYKKTDGIKTSIDMSNHVPSTYFLKITQDNKEVKTFKIIKNQ
jgi:regulation of enolase protein 1 (concanavalin A-like superfamily)